MTCAACGSAGLQRHLQVSGGMEEEELIPTTDRYGAAFSDIVRCPNCGHMQLERMPDEADLSEAYGEAESTDYVEEEPGQRATAARLLERIEMQTEPGPLVDLGCWVGFLLAEARERGWEPVGVEPSEFAAGYARAHLGLDVVTGDLFAADLPEQRFHAVFMGDVIEHIPAAGDAVQRAGRLLAPGGVLAMALPDAGSRVARLMGRHWWSVLPTHVHYFTRNSMRTMLERNNLEVIAMETAPKTFTVGYYLERIGGYRRTLARALVGAARRLRVVDRLWTPNFRDRMLVVARPAQLRMPRVEADIDPLAAGLKR
jgi:SAM-dependent methyltransferase